MAVWELLGNISFFSWRVSGAFVHGCGGMAMADLHVRGVGLVRDANVRLGRLNLVIGCDVSGVDLFMKVAAFCSMAEKELLTLRRDCRLNDPFGFMDGMVGYFNVPFGASGMAEVSYETGNISFSYAGCDGMLRVRRKIRRIDMPSVRLVTRYVPVLAGDEAEGIAYVADFRRYLDGQAGRSSVSAGGIPGTGFGYLMDSRRGMYVVTYDGGRKRMDLPLAPLPLRHLVPALSTVRHLTLDPCYDGSYVSIFMECPDAFLSSGTRKGLARWLADALNGNPLVSLTMTLDREDTLEELLSSGIEGTRVFTSRNGENGVYDIVEAGAEGFGIM